MGQTLDYHIPKVRSLRFSVRIASLASMLFPVVIHAMLGIVWLEARLALGRSPKFGDPWQWASNLGLLAFVVGGFAGIPVFVCGLLSQLTFIDLTPKSRFAPLARALTYLATWVVGTILFIHDWWKLTEWLFD